MKHSFIVFLMTAFMAFFAHADEQAARGFAESTANKAVSILASDASETSKVSQLEDLFVSTVDTNWIGRFVVSQYWNDLEEAEKTDYLAAYKDFLVKHYTSNFQEYADGTTFKITNARALNDGQYRIAMNIIRPRAQPVKVDYRLHQANGGYRIIDIIVEGVSLLNTQRSEFKSVIQRDGVTGLTKKLKAKS